MQYDEAYSSEEDQIFERDRVEEIEVHSAPIAEDALPQFLQRDRSIAAVQHPYLRAGVTWIQGPARKNDQKSRVVQTEETLVYNLPGIHNTRLKPARTQLSCDCAKVFEDLEFAANDEEEFDILLLIAKTSRQYRQLLNNTYEEALRISQEDGLEEEDDILMQIIFESACVWQCAEAIYLTDAPDTLRCDMLMEWVNKMDPRPSEQEGSDIMTARIPCQHPNFWDYLSKGIIRGLFGMVSSCLTSSGLSGLSTATSKVVNELSLLLQTCPRASKYSGKAEDFKVRYRQWRGRVLTAYKTIDLPDPELSSSFRQLYELLRGDRDAIFRQCDTWQECLAAMALLFDPTGCRAPKDVKALFELVTESEESLVGVDITLPTEVACSALCTGNVPKVITQARLIDLQFAALLADLLEKAEVLEDIRSGDLDLTLRDVLILDLGDDLVGEAETWKAAMSYWRTVGDAGIDRIQVTLPRIPTTDQTQVDEILALCNELELFDEASEVETAWGRKLESAGLHFDAINSYDRATNPHQIDRLNWCLFESSLIQGSPASHDPSLKTSLEAPQYTPSRTISSLMAPYATLSHFYSFKSQSPPDMAQAATYLAALLKLPDLPKHLTGILMAEMLPFLKPDGCRFTLRDIFDTLAAIEEFSESGESEAGRLLLDRAMKVHAKSPGGWRDEIGKTMDAGDVLALVRLRIAHSVGQKFCEE